MIFDVQRPDDDGPDPQSEHFEYLRAILDAEQIDEWTTRRLDGWLDGAGKDFRLEKRNPGTLGATTRASVLNVCKALLADGRRFEERLAQVSVMPMLNFQLLEVQKSDANPTEEDFLLWQREIDQMRAKLSQLIQSAERLATTAQEDGSKGGRPRQSERDEIFLALCAQLRTAKPDASNERLAAIGVQVFLRYVPVKEFSEEAALKILQNRLPTRPTQRKKPS